MIPPPDNSGDFEPGGELPCPECCSVWWLSIVTLAPTSGVPEVKGYLDKVRCVNCEYELSLEESEV